MEEQILLFLKSASPTEIKPFLNSLMAQNYESFDQFTDFLERCQPKLSCSANWTSKILIANCKNCRLFDNSCICIQCLLDGNHIQENHQVYISYSTNGNCDCGNSEAWDKKGFCKKHHGQCGHPEEHLPKELSLHLTSIFEVLKKFIIEEIETKSFHFFNELFEFIIQLSEMGDGVRRLASLSFGDEIFLETIVKNCFNFSSNESTKIESFISAYANDEAFSIQFAKSIFPSCRYLYEKTLENCHVQRNISKEDPIIGPSTLLSSIFFVFPQLIKGENGINYHTYYNEITPIAFDFIKSNPSLFEGKNGSDILNNFWYVINIIEYFMKHGMKEENRQLFINVASSFQQIEGYIQPIQKINDFEDDSSYYDYRLFYDFIVEFKWLPFILAKKIEYIPEIIEIFVHFLFTSDDIDHPSFIFLLHKLAVSTLKNAKNPKDEFDRIIRKDELFASFDEKIKNKEEGFDKFKNVYELIYFRASLIPINFLSFTMLSDFDLLKDKGYPKSFSKAVDQYDLSFYVHIDLPFLLSMIQFMFSFSEDKNQFLRLIESKFGVFDPQNSQTKAERMFYFIIVVSHLIFEDPKFLGKKKRIIQLIFMTILKSQPERGIENMKYYSGPTQLNRAIKWYNEVKFESSWHIIIPFISPRFLLKVILPQILDEMSAKSNKKNNTILLPFPDFDDSEIIDLRSLMKSTYLYAVLYDIMYDSNEPILYHYALNLFILLYNNEQPKNDSKVDLKINAVTIDDFVNQIPSNFIEFCDVKINYKRGGSYLSLIDLVENSGSIGLNALHRTIHKRSKKEMKQLKKLKSNIKAIKNKIVSKYKENALNFNYSTVTNLITEMKIKPNDKTFIFVCMLFSSIPDFLETQYHFNFTVKKDNDDEHESENNENKLLSSFVKKRTHLKKNLIASTCGHICTDTSSTVCPYCNSHFNFFIPNFVAAENHDIFQFNINNFGNFFGDAKKWVKLLKTMIIILDYRSRLKPEIIQDEITFLLYRNLFILVHKISQTIDPAIFKNRKSKLGIFLHDFIFNNDSSPSTFTESFFVKYVERFNYIIDYEFLKRIELVRLFYISKNLETIIDIDEHFSFRNLIKMYKIPENFIEPTKYTKYQFYQSIHDTDDFDEKIKIDFDINEEKLPVFRGIDLPENFLQIINDPFNIKFEFKTGEQKLICLATGDIITMNLMNRDNRIPRELTYQPILMVDGQDVNGVKFWISNFFIKRKSIYRNRKGEENVGFNKGDPVFLDHERYIDLFDDYISGRCILNIQEE